MILTNTEYTCAYTKALQQFSCIGYNSMLREKWLFSNSPDTSKLAWLFIYALDSYTHNDTATDNYITEEQATAMFNKINLL